MNVKHDNFLNFITSKRKHIHKTYKKLVNSKQDTRRNTKTSETSRNYAWNNVCFF